MKKDPHVSQFMDQEERDLIEHIESECYSPGQSLLTPELFAKAQTLGRNTLNERSEKISIRIAQSDLARVKAQALRQGIPYQTLIKSIIHQAVTE